MQAIRFDVHGGPEVLRLEELEDPRPGPGEVLVRLRSRGINRAEILTIQGTYARRPPLPATPGREGAGEVEALGEGVDGPAPGTRVMLRNGSALDSGTWCEKVRVRAEDLIPTPEALDDNQAGGVFVSYLTAWCGLVEVLALQRGDSVIVTAASSPTGLATLQVCRLLGLTSFATTRRAERVEPLLQAGADHVVVTGEMDLVEQVRAQTDGAGARAAFDAVSGELGQACFRALVEGGDLLQYGALSLQPLSLNPGSMIFKRLRVQGFWLTPILEQWPRARLDAIYARVVELIADGSFKPRVHRSWPLAEVKAAIEEMNAQRHFGKVVLT